MTAIHRTPDWLTLLPLTIAEARSVLARLGDEGWEITYEGSTEGDVVLNLRLRWSEPAKIASVARYTGQEAALGADPLVSGTDAPLRARKRG